MLELPRNGLLKRTCKCGEMAGQIIDVERRVRVGWYCSECEHFEKAIGRERSWDINDETTKP
jgi:hypothetical protein